jgi:hypothetical protein
MADVTRPAPYMDASPVNFDMLSNPVFGRMFHTIENVNIPILSQEMNSTVSLFGTSAMNTSGQPSSVMIIPIQRSIFDQSVITTDTDSKVVGTLVAEFLWESFFRLASYDDVPNVYLVVNNVCSENRSFTYAVSDQSVTFLGYGDLHEAQFDSHEATYNFAPFLKIDSGDENGEFSSSCGRYLLYIYPSSEFYTEYVNNQYAGSVTGIVMGAFAVASLIFCCYDCAVHVRQRRILTIAAQSEKILSVLYPKTIRDRLFNGSGSKSTKPSIANGIGIIPSRRRGTGRPKKTFQSDEAENFSRHHQGITNRLKSSMIEDGGTDNSVMANMLHHNNIPENGKPIADLFPQTTVLFADIAGFTAWSSSREPCQVFTLLETVYHAFDILAHRRGVFKVETVGDCYVRTM